MPGILQRPMFHLRKVIGEKEEAKKIGDQDKGGMALEGWIRTGERDFTEAQEHGFDKQDGAGHQDGNMK